MTTAALFADLVGAQIEIWNSVDAKLRAEIGAPLSDCEGLRVISGMTEARVNDLADALTITVGGASKLADRLERAGLIARRANPDDRRSHILHLTEAGTTMRERAVTVIDEALVTSIDNRLNTTERAHLAHALTKLRNRGTTATETKGTL
jgi:DNA-binding MarR family transcriptional regulator